MPSYAVIIRELFPAREAGLRVSLAISTTLAGMALGGWLAGAIYDWTGSYAAALVNGIAWNIVNIAIAFGCCSRRSGALRFCGGERSLFQLKTTPLKVTRSAHAP